MYQKSNFNVRNIFISALLLGAGPCMAASDLRKIVDSSVEPLMQQQGIAGLSVAVVKNGQAQYFNYGVASTDSQQPVTEDTLFEIGSLSKTFTATLGGYAQATGKLKLQDKASQHLSALKGSAFDRISLLQLATYTPGGLPLQFPSAADSAETMLTYFQRWKPTYAAGEQRRYSNPSIGLFGYLTAQSLGQPPGGRCFAIGARHSDDLQLLAGCIEVARSNGRCGSFEPRVGRNTLVRKPERVNTLRFNQAGFGTSGQRTLHIAAGIGRSAWPGNQTVACANRPAVS